MPDTAPSADTHEFAIVPPNYDPRSSKTQKSLLPALFALQQELDPIKKTEKNQHLRATYADLKAVWAAIREPLSEHGLLVLQEPHPHERGAMVTTTVVHVESGEWRHSTLFVPSLPQYQKASGTSEHVAQGHGSALTYCRKYSLLTVLGLCTEDDDGQGATTVPANQQPAARTPGPAEYHQANAPEADRKGWEAWTKGKVLQLLGTTNLDALGAAWRGMQPELKTCPEDLQAEVIKAKDDHKKKLTPAGDIDPDADVPF
jgi:hypothetical protein